MAHWKLRSLIGKFGCIGILNMAGALVFTTADAVVFDAIGEFSATNPQGPDQILTIDPSALFLSQLSTGTIATQSDLSVVTTPL